MNLQKLSQACDTYQSKYVLRSEVDSEARRMVNAFEEEYTDEVEYVVGVLEGVQSFELLYF